MARRRGLPGTASGDKTPSLFSPGHKQTGAEKLPSRHAIAELTGGDSFQRSMNNYAKQSPTLTPPMLTGMGKN